MSANTFLSLGLHETMNKVSEQLYFKQPTEIQKEAIPKIIEGKNIIGQSQTGSGKTHAYLLPLMQQIDETKNEVQIVITVPTRELAIQIHEEIKMITTFAEKTDIWHTRLLIGGMDRERMVKKLASTPQIIIGTPGRIADMVHTDALSIYHAKAFVIDEADLIAEMNFLEKIDELLVRTHKQVQLLVFSATIPKTLQIFLNKYLQQPDYIQVGESLTPEKLTHHLINIKHQDVAEKIVKLANIIQPYVALLFVNSKEFADELEGTLKAKGMNVGVLHGGLGSRERTRTIKAIFELKYEYIIATDLASRGMDIKGLSHVINIEMPKEVDFYIHRIGRTARAGQAGMAISFYNESDIPLISSLEQKGVTFQYSDIKNDEIVSVKRYDKRQMRKNITTDLDKEAWQQVRKPKKVKPGYKKKMKKEQENLKRSMKRKQFRKK